MKQGFLWACALVIPFWLWRVGGWFLQDPDSVSWLLAPYGFVVDISLVAAGLAVGGGAWLLGTRLPPGVRGWVPAVVSSLFLVSAVTLRAIDIIYVSFTQSHWTVPAFVYLSIDNLALLGEGDGIVVAVAWAVSGGWIGFTAWAFSRCIPGLAESLRGRRKLAGVVVGLVLVPFIVGVSVDGDPDSPAISHEGNFIRRGLVLFSWEPSDESPLPPAAAYSRWRALGLVTGNIEDPEFPLYREESQEPPFPYPTKSGAPELPNFVFTFVEQFNEAFLDPAVYPGLMPRLNAHAKRMTRVEGYHSVTAPTINALVAGLCSIFSTTASAAGQEA